MFVRIVFKAGFRKLEILELNKDLKVAQHTLYPYIIAASWLTKPMKAPSAPCCR